MSKEDREEMLKYALSDYIMMVENHFPLDNARIIIFDDYELTEDEKGLLVRQMLEIIEDKVGTL